MFPVNIGNIGSAQKGFVSKWATPQCKKENEVSKHEKGALLFETNPRNIAMVFSILLVKKNKYIPYTCTVYIYTYTHITIYIYMYYMNMRVNIISV